MKIVIDTLGCKLNQAESELLARRFAEAGHSIVSSIDEADIFIVNTCTVTRTADAKSRRLLRKAHRRNPGAVLVAAGCYPQRVPEVLAAIEGVSVVAGNADKLRLPEILEESGYLKKPDGPAPVKPVFEIPESRTRSFIEIQDGCSRFCSYCIVPFVRGKEKSIPAEDVIKQINNRASDGIREVVLTGTEIGSYNWQGMKLDGLLSEIVSRTGIERIRLSSLQPEEITPGLLSLWDNRRLCPHFHLSLQSGSDTVLRRMNRRYDTADYREAVSLIKSNLPDAAITTDVIAGFPGETDEEYGETYGMCRETGFARIHVFPYSARPGTAAAAMPEQVPDAVKTQRNRNLGALSTECAESFRRRFTGRTMDVLWEKQSGGVWSGYTGNYIRVYTGSKTDLTNRITPAKLTGLHKDGIWGEVVINI